MPTDPSQLAPDSVSISPQQQGVVRQIAQSAGYASQDPNLGNPAARTPTASKPSMMSQIGDVGTKMLQAFAMARMGQDYVGQQLRAKYHQEAQEREFSERSKLAKQDAERDFIMKGVQQYGSQFLKNDKIMKGLDPREVQMYSAMGQAVDHENQLSAQAAKALGLPPELAHLPKQILEMINNQQKAKAEQLKAQTEQGTAQIRQNTALQEGNIRTGIANIEAGTAKTRADIAKIDEQKARETGAKGTKDTNYTRNTAATNEFTKLYPPPKGWFGLGGNKPGDKKYENQLNSWKIKERNIDPKSGRMLKPTGIDVPKGVEDGYQTDPSDGKEYLIFEGKMYELL